MVDTLDYGLTLVYITLNLALIGPRWGPAPREEARCAEGPGGPWSALLDACTGLGYWLGPGNTNNRVLAGYYPSHHPPGIPPSQYPTRQHVGVTGQHEGYTGPGDTRNMHI